jgi:mevalonate kinase
LRVKASAPGKAILFGEHSVVYRGPAVVLAIDRRVYISAEPRGDELFFVEAPNLRSSGFFDGGRYNPLVGGAEGEKHLKPIWVAAKGAMEKIGRRMGISLSISSEIPVAVGLGSSAAATVATVAAIGELLEGGLRSEEISSIAFEAEKIVHGTPSGIDNTIATYGGVLVYEKGREVERLKSLGDVPFVIGNTGRSRSTGQQVGRVGELRERNMVVIDSILDTISRVAQLGRDALLEKDLRRVGELMNINHGLLWAIGVSNPELDRLVNAALNAGALGAKLTGAGGGGCMISLSTAKRLDAVSGAIERSGGSPLRVKISNLGVKVWREKD